MLATPQRTKALNNAATRFLPVRISLIEQNGDSRGSDARENGSELRFIHSNGS